MKLTTQKQFRVSRHFMTFALSGLMFSTGIGFSQQAGFAHTSASAIALTTPRSALPSSVELKVRQAAAQQFNIPLREIQVVNFSQQTWTDGCLGLGGAAESCLQALVEGWQIEVSSGQQNWLYRTDKNADTIRLAPNSETGVTLPASVSQRLLRTVARQVRVPMRRLKVVEVRSATWDGCLGIFKPGQACTKIALSGWQAIVTNGDRSWVYHLDQSGNRIAQNPTASGSQGGLVPSFIPEENLSSSEKDVVFQSIVSGDLAGKVTQLTLTQDGAITQWIMGPNIRSRPIVVKRLSQQQVEQFQQMMQTQRLPNFHRLRYLSSAAMADYPTTTLKGMGITVQYIDLEIKNLPKALQDMVQTWAQLSASAQR